MVRKFGLLLCCAILLGSESVYFARRTAAGLFRLRGERAFFRNDHEKSWDGYRRSLALGGDRDRLETDQAELLLFGLDQSSTGARVRPALPPQEAVRVAFQLLARRISETPYRAYDWALVSDVYFHAARLHRREMPLDLSSLTDNPLDILLPEERLGLAALQTASRLEPNNYIYHDLLVEKFLELGSVSRAAIYCRRSVAANPVVGDHPYLLRPNLDPELFEAAIQGFDDSRRVVSMIPRAVVDADEGEFLRQNGQTERAIEFLNQALERAPDLFDARFDLGMANYTLARYDEALRHLREASRRLPEAPGPHAYMGFVYMAKGDLPAAIDQFRTAREKEPRDVGLFHTLGDALEKAGQVGEAERQYVAAANVNPESTEAWAAVLAFYTRHRDLRPFPEVCTRLRAMDPGVTLYQEQCASLGLEVH